MVRVGHASVGAGLICSGHELDVAEAPIESVTVTVYDTGPVTAVDPLITPVVDEMVNPVGSPFAVNEYAGRPPDAVAKMLLVYVVCASIVVTVGHATATRGSTCSLHTPDTDVPPTLSVTLAEYEKFCATASVPLSAPFAASVAPVSPVSWLNVYPVPDPEDAVKEKPASGSPTCHTVTVGHVATGAGATTIVHERDAVPPIESVAVTVNVFVPATVGVPAIAPVAAVSDKFCGSSPDVTANE